MRTEEQKAPNDNTIMTNETHRKRRRSDDYTSTHYTSGRSLFNNAFGYPTVNDEHAEPERPATKAKLADDNVAPFLARHIPTQYAPLGADSTISKGPPPPSVNSRYCYRHRPDLKCRRQAGEPSMDQMQQVCKV